jgi:hypothetical protein
MPADSINDELDAILHLHGSCPHFRFSLF